MNEKFETLAKCTCGSMLLFMDTDHGEMWVHWRPISTSLDTDFPHKIIKNSEFVVDEADFAEWNKKTPEELESYMASISDFWRTLNEESDMQI